MQTLEAQSLATVHILPSVHDGQVVPPQSMSLSVPLRTPSLHEGAVQVPAVQTPDLQPIALVQASPSPHGPQLPPQSTSTSVPFFAPSLHVGTWQMPPVQTLLAHWSFAVQDMPDAFFAVQTLVATTQ